ncbi:hypothetical protein [Metamycoplasma gateae]|uniref:Uncharacterized protein n=1 Tax=Metamycoplasma gateae TaxID=35769 RepID=A0ABZ2AHI2_9BACT|nr:hypothetical protein V2E26_01090 [Metamycoplasma gateae]
MAKEKFKNLFFIKPILKDLLKNILRNANTKNIENIKLIESLDEKERKIELEFIKRVRNFEYIKNSKLITNETMKNFIIDTINNLDEIDRSILLTILFRKDLENISWKTFNISKSTFYRRIKFIEKMIKWCFSITDSY